jgi:predicted type IV restriction endonuclease
MNELLADIKDKLQSGDYYKNEEHIRLSLVARVLQNLGWDIWNPKEVNTEFIVVPNEDKTREDVALFLRPFCPMRLLLWCVKKDFLLPKTKL